MATRRITEKLAERIKPPRTGRIEICDEVLSGLCLRVTQKGRKTWSVVYRYAGKQTRLTLGTYPVLKTGEAREEARQALQLVAKGIDPAVRKRTVLDTKERETVSAVVEEFIERYAKPKNRTWKSTQQLFDYHIVPRWGSRPMADITRKDVIALLDDLVDNGTPYAARHTFAALRKLFNWAAERSIIEVSPCLHIKTPGKAVSRDRVLSDDEIATLWPALEGLGYPFGPLLQFLLVTGQRLREVADMQWPEINTTESLWSIPRERTKSDRAHDVPLSPLALSLLESLPRFTGNYIFTTTNGNKPVSGFSKAKERLDKAATLEQNWRVHDFRRTLATGIAKLGFPASTVSKVLNHTDRSVTAIYNRHAYLPEKREALDAWAGKLREIVDGKKNS